jgi:integrase
MKTAGCPDRSSLLAAARAGRPNVAPSSLSDLAHSSDLGGIDALIRPSLGWALLSNFRTIDRQTGYLLPPSLDEWLPQRHLARFIVEVIEGLDLSAMSRSYRSAGSASYHPTLLKLRTRPTSRMACRFRTNWRGARSACGARISILTVAPMRAKTWRGSDLVGISFRPGPGGVRHIVIPPAEVKNGAALSYEVPGVVSDVLEVYLTRCRPLLSGDPQGIVFPARKGGAKSPAQLAEQIKRAVLQETGIDLNAHAYRHLAAKLYLAANPGDIETVRLLLGHKDRNTTDNFYCVFYQTDALRRYDALIDRYRKKGGPMSRRPPVENWPAGDRERWRKGVEPGGLFGGGRAGADWSDASRFKTARGYDAWLRWLAAHKQLDLNMEPADRVTCEHVAAYVAKLQAEVSPYTVLCPVQELYDALRAMAPGTDWVWLAQLYRNLRKQVRPVRDKLAHVKAPQELMAVGERLMDEAEAAPEWSARRRAVAYRDGLLIALLAYSPIRLKNLAMMRLGRYLRKVSGCWQILFATDESKSKVPYEAIFPSAIESRLERYLDVHRPVLMRGERADGRADAAPINQELDAVWVSEVGTHLEYRALERRIFVQTRDAFGCGIYPHMFRDCAATAVAVVTKAHRGCFHCSRPRRAQDDRKAL